MALSLSFPRSRTTAAVVGVAAAALVAVAPTASGTGVGASPATRISAAVDPALHGLTGSVRVVIRGARASEAGVAAIGGRISHELPLIGGYSATVPAREIPRIAHLQGVTSITSDAPLHVQSLPQDATSDAVNALPDVYKQVIHADALQSAGDSGQGVTVALVDTGVTPMADTASRLVPVQTSPAGTTATCMNFAGDGTCDDKYGHGTFLAGLIAGTGAASNGQYTGVAPAAKILSVKISGADGSSDVSTIIAAIQYVIAFRNTYNIKVLNLSLGTDGSQSYQLSPLDYAVEKAWKSGIAVVVSASNRGPAASTIDKPADDPYVITVGSTDDMGTVDTSDDTVPDFSARGPTSADGLAKPDVVAPGGHLISLAAPGASITTQFPPTMPAPYRRGSGTSMSAAVVSGLVADLLSAKSSWSPDRVKYALTSTAGPDASTDRMSVGAGLVDGTGALGAGAGLANQNIASSNGLGTLQADRGSVQVSLGGSAHASANPLQGEVTAQLSTYNAAQQLFATFSGGNWWGGNWWGGNWWSTAWYGGNWWGGNWWGGNWWGGNWWGGAWYGAWD